MSSNKKRCQSPEEEGTSSTRKRVKQEAADESVFWEWEDDGHAWKKFSGDLTAEIENGFKSGMQKLKVKINDHPFDIIFERMVQRNSKTFWERRIRANIEGQDGGLSGSYQFQEDDGSWKAFDHSVQRLIYAAKLYNIKQVIYPVKGQKYTLNLEKLKQLNYKTKRSRDIKDGSDNVKIKNENTTKANAHAKIKKDKNKENIQKNDTSSLATQKKVTKVKQENEEDVKEEKPAVKSITFKGKAPVDQDCFAREKYHVYCEGSNIYDAMLNQTNLKNNNNKFYLMQLLQTTTNSAYAVWFRWGRVGLTGQTNLINCGKDLDQAKEIFCKKFFDKTKNEFSDRKKFKKVQGKYDLVIIDYKKTVENDEVDGPPKSKKPREIPPSKLDKKVQDLVELICNVQEMEEAIMEMKYDTKKAPLGKLTKEQIKAGYKALKLIDKCIANKDAGNKLIEACDAFYTRIPHCFGMQRPPVIRTRKEVKLKIELLEALGDIEIAMNVLKEKSGDAALNPIDQHYINLNCEITLLKRDSNEFKIIEKYTQITHAKTHNLYKMEVLDVYEVRDERQIKNYNDTGNKMLLWHGSRLTNWCGILSQGLRIAPPEAPVTGYMVSFLVPFLSSEDGFAEAPVTGYMFGKGVYFADMSSKSANYCYPTRSKNSGLVLLCEVSLGKTNDLLAADYEADQLPTGCNSTKGLGKIAPKQDEYVTLPDGVVVPCGTPAETGVTNPDGYTLNYNGDS